MSNFTYKDKYEKVPKKSHKTEKISSILSIDSNSTLHVEIDKITSRFKIELLGISHKEYLVLKLPKIIDASFLDQCKTSTGNFVICRYVYKGTVYGFRSQLMGIITTPVLLMVLAYPKSVEECTLRKEKRAYCILPARIKFGANMYNGSILDISEAGCQMAILSSSIDEKDVQIIGETSSNDIIVLVRFPGVSDEIKLPVIRRNVKHYENKICVGLEFHKIDEKAHNIINEAVEELVKFSSTVGIVYHT